MKYRIGLPFWKTLARCGLSLTFRVKISKDQDRNCYYVSSSDLGGLTTEAKTLEELAPKIYDRATDILEEFVPRNNLGSIHALMNFSQQDIDS